MVKIDLRNALEYDVTAGYAIFKPNHENLAYSDIDPKLEFPRTPSINTIQEYQKLLESSNLFFIVEETGNEVGYIILDVTTDGTAKIQEMMVKKEFRGRRYGAKAIKALIQGLSEDEEIKEVTVFSATIATDNFYSSCDFRYVGGDTYKYQLKV